MLTGLCHQTNFKPLVPFPLSLNFITFYKYLCQNHQIDVQDWFTEVSWTSPHLVHILDCKWNRQVLLQTSRLLAIRIVHNSEDGTQVSLQFLRPPWTSVFKLYHECHTPTDIQVKPSSFVLHLSESSGHN